MSLRITSLERTLVDVSSTAPGRSGGWEEIWRSLESVEFFDLDKIVGVCLSCLATRLPRPRMGFYLDQHRESLMVEGSHLVALRSQRPKQPRYVDRRAGRDGSLVTEWNLVVPTELVERS